MSAHAVMTHKSSCTSVKPSHYLTLLFWLLCSTEIMVCYVNGDYILEVRTLSYSSPSNACYTCRTEDDQREGCCDNYNVFECTGNQRCDTYFYYCLQEYRSEILECSGGQQSKSAFQDVNSVSVNFTQDEEILGLPNPLTLNGLSTRWNGIQLYIEALDFDGNELTTPTESDDVIDRFQVDITAAPLPAAETLTFSGIYEIATIGLSFSVECATNYYGSDCAEFCDPGNCECRQRYTGEVCSNTTDDCIGVNCSGNGACVDGLDSFQCNCNLGYTGAQCDVNIDDCVEVTCSGNGRCEDGVNNFTCICNSGFTGQLCETNIDDCIGVDCSGNGRCEDGVASFTCVCDPGFTGDLCKDTIEGNETVTNIMPVTLNGTVAPSSTVTVTVQVAMNDLAATLGGGLIGGIVLLGLVLAVIVSVIILTKWCIVAANQHDAGPMDIKDNNAYARTFQSSLCIIEQPTSQAEPLQSIEFPQSTEETEPSTYYELESDIIYYTAMDLENNRNDDTDHTFLHNQPEDSPIWKAQLTLNHHYRRQSTTSTLGQHGVLTNPGTAPSVEKECAYSVYSWSSSDGVPMGPYTSTHNQDAVQLPTNQATLTQQVVSWERMEHSYDSEEDHIYSSIRDFNDLESSDQTRFEATSTTVTTQCDDNEDDADYI